MQISLEAIDLDLHCLHRQDIFRFSRSRVNPFIPADHYTETFEISVDPDEMTHTKISHQNLNHLTFCFILRLIFLCFNNGCVKIQKQKSPFQKLRGERVNELQGKEE